MWHLDWELDEWFLDVKRKRDEQFRASSGGDYENTPESGAVWEDNKAQFSRFLIRTVL